MASQLIASGFIGANGVVQSESPNVKAILTGNTITLAVDGINPNNYLDYFVLASSYASIPGGSFVMGNDENGNPTISFLAADGVTFTNTPITQFAVFKI